MVRFAGRAWEIKSGSRIGPGPNEWAAENVRLDDLGLHLRLDRAGGRWRCAEVRTRRSLGYGDYTWEVEARLDRFDPSVVLGLFTYRNDLSELDIEFARWGWDQAKAGQFVCQPAGVRGNRFRFAVRLRGPLTRHTIAWRSHQVTFSSFEVDESGGIVRPLAHWVYTGEDVPKAGTERAHTNLWLFRGEPPADGLPVEVVVRTFRFRPFR
jgi:hypothetical protein